MPNTLVIFNPKAKRGRAYRRMAKVQQALESAGLPFEMIVSEQPGHAVELARRAALAGRELIVAAGGDGTVNEVVNGLLQAANGGDVSCSLGVLPVGSGNDFANSLGIPTDLRQAAEKLKLRQVRRIDIGCVNGRHFANNVGLGFEAMINLEAHKLTWLPGQPGYLVAVFRAMISYPYPVVDVTLDDGDLPQKTILMISVGNNRRIGGGFLITPHAAPDDGLLDVCLVDAIPRLEILRLLPKAITGNHAGEPAVHMLRSRRILIHAQDPLPVHADGEILWQDAHRLEITLEPGRLAVIV
jgi:YegS/Rv2252/BmrU family lipid kinase